MGALGGEESGNLKTSGQLSPFPESQDDSTIFFKDLLFLLSLSLGSPPGGFKFHLFEEWVSHDIQTVCVEGK